MAHITFDKFMEVKRKEGEEIGIKKGEKKEKENSRKKQNAIIEKCITKFPDWTDKQIAEFVEVDEDIVKKIRQKI